MGRRGQSKQCEKAAHMPLTAMREHGRSRSTRRQQAVIHTRQGQRTKGKDAMDTGPVGCGRRPDNQHTGEVSWEEPAAPDPLRFRHPPRLPLGCRGAKRRQKQRHRTPSSRRHHRQVLLVPILSGFLPLSISKPYLFPNVPDGGNERPLAPFFLPTSTLPNSTQISPPLGKPPGPSLADLDKSPPQPALCHPLVAVPCPRRACLFVILSLRA